MPCVCFSRDTVWDTEEIRGVTTLTKAVVFGQSYEQLYVLPEIWTTLLNFSVAFPMLNVELPKIVLTMKDFLQPLVNYVTC